MKLIHITDTHLVAPGMKLYGLDPRARLDAAIADINRHHADAELVVVTGDLTNWGEVEAYSRLSAQEGHAEHRLYSLESRGVDNYGCSFQTCVGPWISEGGSPPSLAHLPAQRWTCFERLF